MTYDLAEEYNFTEDDGTLPKYKFTVKNILNKMNHPWLAALFPEEVKMPKSLVYLASNKLWSSLFGWKFEILSRFKSCNT